MPRQAFVTASTPRSSRTLPVAAASVRAEVLAVPAAAVLAAMVAVSAAVRWAAAAGHDTLTFFTDEHIYASLARGIAGGGVSVRGEEVVFPALLHPLLISPAWLVEDPALALRLTQGVQAVAFSLAAVPVYLLARHLRLGTGLSLAAAAFVLAHPGLLYVSFVLAEPTATPLALAAFYAGVRALDAPSPGTQAAFLAFAGLATLARIQYAFLPLAFLAAALVLERGSVRRAARRYRLTLALVAAPLVVLAVLDPRRLLGVYWSFPADWYAPGPLLEWGAKNLVVLAYSAGWVLVPGAVVAVALALVRPLERRERAFAVLLLLTGAALLFEAAVIAAIDSVRVEERYLLMLPPLLAVAFGLWWKHGRGDRRVAAALALALLLLSARVPLAEFSVGGSAADSPTLRALVALETRLDSADASLAFAAVAGLLALVAAAAALRPVRGRPVLAVSALAAVAALSAGAHLQDAAGADRTRELAVADDPRWIDRHGLGGVTLLQTERSLEREGGFARPLSQLFWNRSVDEVVLLDGAKQIDPFAVGIGRVAADGRLLVDGRPLARPLLVNTAGVDLTLAGATLLASEAGFDLWLPRDEPRVSSAVRGRNAEGRLGGEGDVTLWPDGSGRVRGTLTITLSLPRGFAPSAVELTAPGFSRRVRVGPGETRAVSLDVDARAPWSLAFRAERPGAVTGDRPVGVRGGVSFRRGGAG